MQNDAVFIEVVAPFRKRKAIGLVEPAILAVQHSALHRCREGQALTLLQILLNCEVIVIDLAVFLDNTLQTGFFFDDAAVEPIGVRSDAVNTGNVLLEYAFRIKDAACFFRCSIGDQRRDSGSCVSEFGVQIVGIAVNDRPTGLLQLTILVVFPAISIHKPAVPDLPLCIQRHIAGQFKDCALIGIGGSAAICGSVPADELVLVALTGKGVGIQGSIHIDFKALRLHIAFAAVGIEGDGVEHTGSCRVLCRISGILFSNHDLRTPAGEGVAVVLVRSLIRVALEGRHGALQIIFLSYDLVINYPSDMRASLRNFRALLQQFIADSAVGVAGVAICRKRCFDRIANFGRMTGGGNHFLFNKNFVANRAVLALTQAGLSASRLNFRINDLGMALGRDFFLGNEYSIAGRAVPALSLAGFGAGRFNFRINDLGMALCGNLLLRNEYSIADRAVLARSLAGFGAGRLNSRISDLGMALGRDHFLRNEYSIADGAVLALGQTSLRAGRSLCCIDYFCVARSGDFFQTRNRRAADGALRTGCMTSLGAGSGLSRNVNKGMPGCVDCFGLGCIANRAGVGLDTGVLTGRRGRDLALIPAVALGGDFRRCNENFVADGAVLARSLAGFGASCLNSRVSDLGVALGRNHFLLHEDFVADRAVLALGLAGFDASRINCRISDFGMTCGRNHFLRNKNFVAGGAVLTLSLAGRGAGCRNSLVNDLGVSRGLND